MLCSCPKPVHLAIVLGGLVSALPSFAAIPAIPGVPAVDQALIRQQERERAQQEQRQPVAPDVRLELPRAAEAGRLPDGESPCFVIRRIVLDGEMAGAFRRALAAADPAADPASGRCLGDAGINLVMKRVQDAIVAQGYVTTQVRVAQQDLGSGTLALTVVPGRVRAIRFSEDSSPRATRWNALPVRAGDVLNLRDIEQGLENFKRVPTADADIRIEPVDEIGAAPGDSDLLIAWRQDMPFRVGLSVDDSGSRSTGRYQGSATVSYDHWWTLNDLFYASFNHDLGGGEAGQRGSRGYTVHYELPFDYWLLGLTSSSYDYHQAVAGANQTYRYSGDSHNNEIRLSRLLYRDAVRKTGVWLRGWARESKNFIDDTEVGVQRRSMAGWEAGLNQRVFIGPATLDASLGYRRGTGAMGAIPAPEEGFGEGTSRLALISADAQLTLPFTAGPLSLRYGGTWRAQWNRTPLVPQDRFSIGGRYSVRGFDGEMSLSAERGWLLRNDLGVMLGQSGQELYLGLDYGRVGGPSTRQLVGTSLAGAVLGLRGAFYRLNYDLFAGQALRQPDGFLTAQTTAGFNLTLAY